MSYHIYAVDGPYISGKKHDKITFAMQTLSKYLVALDRGEVDSVCAIKTDSTDQILFSKKRIRGRYAVFHKVYSGLMTGGREKIYVSGHSNQSVTKSLLDDLLRDEIVLQRIEVYDFDTGEFIMARQKDYSVDGESARDVSLEEIAGESV